MNSTSEASIIGRIIEPEKPALALQLARQILQWEFAEADRHQMHILLEKAKQGTLSRQEKSQAETYERVGHLLSVLKAKARASLRSRPL